MMIGMNGSDLSALMRRATSLPIHVRHHDIEQDEIRRRLGDHAQRGLAVGGGDGAVAERVEPHLEDLDVVRVVVER